MMLPYVRQQLTNKMEEDHQLVIQVIQYENVEGQKDVYQDQLQRWMDGCYLHYILLYSFIAIKETILIMKEEHNTEINISIAMI